MLPSTSLTLEEVHLVRCLTKISQRYFAPGRSVVISSPATYRDVQQELIAEIHRTSIWPAVVTVDGRIIIPEKSEFIDRGGSYIILIPDGNIESINADILGLALDRKKEFNKSGILKLGLLMPEQMNSQCHNKRTYLIISHISEYITALL